MEQHGTEKEKWFAFILNRQCCVCVCVCELWDVHQTCSLTKHLMSLLVVYIYAFSRGFYPTRLTVHSGYTFLSVCVFPGNRTHNLCAANTMLYHWATGTHLFNCVVDRTSLDWAHSFKNGLSAVKYFPVLWRHFWFCRSCPECGCDFSGSFIYRYVFKQMF